MKENLIIIHGGGPTAVLNCSLYGAVREAQASGLVEHVYGAVGGTGGLLKEKLLDFGSVPEEELERLDCDTVGGLVFALLPVIPEDGSRPVVEAMGLRIRVEELCERRVEWALVEKLEPAPLS